MDNGEHECSENFFYVIKIRNLRQKKKKMLLGQIF